MDLIPLGSGSAARGGGIEEGLPVKRWGLPTDIGRPTPDQAWAARVPIGDDNRVAFRSRAAEVERTLLAHDVAATVARRRAIRQALEEDGILKVWRRRVRLPIGKLKWAKIP